MRRKRCANDEALPLAQRRRIEGGAASCTESKLSHQRSVVCYLGPTNSGKTHEAIEFLSKRGKGAYAGPLRLLALEVCTRLRERLGFSSVGCVTGEAEDNADADIVCCTAECAPDGGDTLVLDEVHWLIDEQRGPAWTRLLVLASQWQHVRICGPVEAEPLLRRVFADRGADVSFSVVQKHRLSRLSFGGPWLRPLKDLCRIAAFTASDSSSANSFASTLTQPTLKPVTGVIAFTKAAVLGVAWAIKQSGLRVVALYGAQPAETRHEILQQVNAGEVDVVVCTDVIGHGLNLPLDAVLFISTSKWDGRRMRPLHLWELAQIAGRAGRGSRRPGTVYTLRISGLPDEMPDNDALEDAVAIANGDAGATTDLHIGKCMLRPSLSDLRRLGAGDNSLGQCVRSSLADALEQWEDTSAAARSWKSGMRAWCAPVGVDLLVKRCDSLPIHCTISQAKMLETAWSLVLLPVKRLDDIASVVMQQRSIHIPTARIQRCVGGGCPATGDTVLIMPSGRSYAGKTGVVTSDAVCREDWPGYRFKVNVAGRGDHLFRMKDLHVQGDVADDEFERAMETLSDVLNASRVFPDIISSQGPTVDELEELYRAGADKLAQALQERIDKGGLCPRCGDTRENLRHRLCESCHLDSRGYY